MSPRVLWTGILMFGAGDVSAEDWTPLTKGASLDTSVAYKTVRQEGPYVVGWTSHRFHKPTRSADGQVTFRIMDALVQVDCGAMALRSIRVIYRDLKGGVIGSEQPERLPMVPAAPGSEGYTVARAVCHAAGLRDWDTE
jgi:hypothetical protein